MKTRAPNRRARTRSCVPLALLLTASACSDARVGSDPHRPILSPERADAPALPDQPDAEAIARASATDLARAPNDVDWSHGDAAHGQVLYAADCSLCHGGGGAGDGLATPALNPKPRDFTTGRFYIDASANNRTGEDVDLARVILNGPGAFGGSRAMPAWRDALSESDVRDLIAYIRTLARPNVAVARRPRARPAS